MSQRKKWYKGSWAAGYEQRACMCNASGWAKTATRKSRSGICIAILHVCEVDNNERVPAGWIDGTHRVAPAACNIREIQDRWTAWICKILLLELGTRLHRS